MSRYFSTFITGFSEIITSALKDKLADLEIQKLDDGVLVYRTEASAEQIKSLRFFNNSFLLVKQLNIPDIQAAIKDFLQHPSLDDIELPQGETFRVVTSLENSSVKIDRRLLEELEAYIAGTTALELSRAGADLEFWVITRSEGYTLIGVRLTSHGNYEKTLQKGELRPELSHLLCLLSQPSADDIFLDPFAGFGSIPIERAKAFPCREVIASDNNPEIIENCKLKMSKARAGALENLKLTITVKQQDGTQLNDTPDNSITKIVTDPPWGIFIKQENLPQFYHQMFDEFYRVLAPHGLAVILTAQKELMDNLLNQFKDKFTLLEKIDTLVNGKKSAVYVLKQN